MTYDLVAVNNETGLVRTLFFDYDSLNSATLVRDTMTAEFKPTEEFYAVTADGKYQTGDFWEGDGLGR